VDAFIAEGAPELEAWQAWHPTEAQRILSDLPVPWYVAGGWAIDLGLGRQTRRHEDLEIAIARTDFARYREFVNTLGRFDLYDAGDGRLTRLDGGPSNPDNHQIWLLDRDAQVWRMDTFLEARDQRTWRTHRDPRIEIPMTEAVRRTADGIPYLAPALVLYMKAKAARPKDDADLRTVLPTLDTDERDLLARTIALVHPGHRWLDTIRGTTVDTQQGALHEVVDDALPG
jgi:hypothetical protein